MRQKQLTPQKQTSANNPFNPLTFQVDPNHDDDATNPLVSCFDPELGVPLITNVHPSGHFITCMQYAKDADPRDNADAKAVRDAVAEHVSESDDVVDDGSAGSGAGGSAGDGSAGSGAGSVTSSPGYFRRIVKGDWIMGALEGALPYTGLPAPNDHDNPLQFPYQYADGVGDSYKRRDNTFDHFRAQFTSLAPSDFDQAPETLRKDATFTTEGPFDFEGKARSAQAFEQWTWAARRKFAWNEEFHHVSSTHLDAETIKTFRGTRKKARGSSQDVPPDQVTCQ
jgi:hypothetical protein